MAAGRGELKAAQGPGEVRSCVAGCASKEKVSAKPMDEGPPQRSRLVREVGTLNCWPALKFGQAFPLGSFLHPCQTEHLRFCPQKWCASPRS